jgi:uncharacterized protein YlxW (UPF0749 family)
MFLKPLGPECNRQSPVRRSLQAATSQLNGNTHVAAEARLRDAEAAAAQREADLKTERDALAAKCAALQSQIADLQAQLKAAKVRTPATMLVLGATKHSSDDELGLRPPIKGCCMCSMA